jgi:hypothetical protein
MLPAICDCMLLVLLFSLKSTACTLTRCGGSTLLEAFWQVTVFVTRAFLTALSRVRVSVWSQVVSWSSMGGLA